jgi:hypothetical protein
MGETENMIFKAYSYLFYKFYSWALWLHGEKSAPSATALGTISILGILNWITGIAILQIFTGISVDPFFHLSRSMVFIFGMVVLFLINLDLMKNNKDKCKKIIRKFNQEDANERMKGTVFVWCYILGSIFLLVLSSYLAKYAHDTNFTVIGYLHSIL